MDRGDIEEDKGMWFEGEKWSEPWLFCVPNHLFLLVSCVSRLPPALFLRLVSRVSCLVSRVSCLVPCTCVLCLLACLCVSCFVSCALCLVLSFRKETMVKKLQYKGVYHDKKGKNKFRVSTNGKSTSHKTAKQAAKVYDAWMRRNKPKKCLKVAVLIFFCFCLVLILYSFLIVFLFIQLETQLLSCLFDGPRILNVSMWSRRYASCRWQRQHNSGWG